MLRSRSRRAGRTQYEQLVVTGDQKSAFSDGQVRAAFEWRQADRRPRLRAWFGVDDVDFVPRCPKDFVSGHHAAAHPANAGRRAFRPKPLYTASGEIERGE